MTPATKPPPTQFGCLGSVDGGFIALGVREFLSIGTAGGLQPDLAPVTSCSVRAPFVTRGPRIIVRRPEVEATPDARLTEEPAGSIRAAGLAVRRGVSWTIDTPHRETAAEAKHYQHRGVLCVEMEAAALFTVAAHRGASIAAAFCVSDSLADAEWNPSFDHPQLAHNLLALFGAAVDVARIE